MPGLACRKQRHQAVINIEGRRLMQKLSKNEIDQKIKSLNNWSLEGHSIKKSWQFSDFKEAMKFINEVADLANEQDHHPEIFNVYNKVELKFSTHDAGGLTDRDFKIAAAIDRLK
jgi:4a-hydroxytetrahydrobiopterin dehydratase